MSSGRGVLRMDLAGAAAVAPASGDTGKNGVRVVGLVGNHRHARLDVLKQPERLRAVGPLPRGQVKRPRVAAVVDRDMKFGCLPTTAAPNVL